MADSLAAKLVARSEVPRMYSKRVCVSWQLRCLVKRTIGFCSKGKREKGTNGPIPFLPKLIRERKLALCVTNQPHLKGEQRRDARCTGLQTREQKGTKEAELPREKGARIAWQKSSDPRECARSVHAPRQLQSENNKKQDKNTLLCAKPETETTVEP